MEVLFALMLAGALFGRFAPSPLQAAGTLERFVIQLSLPALVLERVPGLEIDARSVVPVGVAWAVILLSALLVLIAARLFRWDRNRTGALLLVVSLGNTSFFGLPAVRELLGDAYIGPALLYDQLGSFVGLVTWGTFVAVKYGHGARPSALGVAARVLGFPPFLALVAAFALRSIGPGAEVLARIGPVTEPLAATLVPMTMVAIGMRLRIPRNLHVAVPLLVGLVICLVLAPAAVYLAMRLVGEPSIEWKASVLEAAMPPMITASVVATAAGLDEELSSALAAVGVLAALVTTPLWAAALVG